MTTAGVCITSPDHAFIWADTRRSGPDGDVRHASKLAVNVAAGMVGVGIGPVVIGDQAKKAMMEAESYEDAQERVRRALLRATLRLAETHPDMINAPAFILAGLHRRHPAATVFELATGFAPIYVRKWCAPYLDEIEEFHPTEAADLLPLAVAQCIAGGWANAPGNALTVAMLMPDVILARRVADLSTGTLLGRPVGMAGPGGRLSGTVPLSHGSGAGREGVTRLAHRA